MKDITYIGEMGGGKQPMIVTFPITTETDLKKGTPIFYNQQTVSTLSDENSTLIGILAEDYYCEENEFIPDSGSGEIKVITSHNAVYECDALIIQPAGYEDPAVVLEIPEVPTKDMVQSMNGSRFVLCEKSENSPIEESNGTVYTATCEKMEGPYLYLVCGLGAVSSEDKFKFLPPYGYEYLNLASNGDISLGINVKGNIKIVGGDEKRGTIRFMLKDII